MEQDEIRRFFAEAPITIHENRRLRIPQIEGYDATREHFTSKNSHAILRIPVGCGKTGLMGIAPFGLAQGRVLIIAPNLEIRDGVAAELDYTNSDCIWRKTRALTDFTDGPHRAVLDGKNANISDCENSHIVVTNIHQLASSADRWLPEFPDDFFDLILVDEGHHNAAASWTRVFERFPNAKVVSLTATPFRSDGAEVEGEIIYTYRFSQAMRQGYIKQITAANVDPTELYFTHEGSTRRLTRDQVLDLREEAWFRKGIALSRETNISIVDASIQWLEVLRDSGTKHQIIAATCSINHAREVASLYRERGYKAEAVDSKMKKEDRQRVMEDLKAGRLDCIAQVNVLGEGFDHPPLSVAAIFRPFRGLSPYVQFVGRIMRVLVQNAPEHEDNQGYVVSHIGLQQDARWEDFKAFDREDQMVFGDWLDPNDNPTPEGERERRASTRPGMEVLEQLIERFSTDEFLDPEDEGSIDELMHKIPQLLGVDPDELGLTREDLVQRLLDARNRRAAGLRPERLPVQPQQQRQERRKRLDEVSRSVAGRMLQALGEAPAAPTLIRLFPDLGARNNMGATIQLMHRAVNERFGFSRDGRPDLTLEQLTEATDSIEDIGDEVEALIRGRRQERS
ncbi:MAG: DEAD/DEAH box helicase family protein [bacterium]|nr:DEAD/DEAH box helicase family protein [bacterium]